jgi:glycerophosphoryl diester phosphodiesterase
MTPLLLGHRGDPEHHPENTLRGFRAALGCGADGVELDVRVSADGVPVVIHDATLERTSDGSGPVCAHSWPELARLRVAGTEPLPSLEQVLAALRAQPGMVAVEVKPAHAEQPELAAQVVAMAERLGMAERVWLLAFDHAHLAAVRGRVEAGRCVALVAEPVPDPVALLRDCGAAVLGARLQIVNAGLCNAVHAAGCAVLAWTVDEEADALRLAGLDVATIVSNRPCTLAPLLRTLGGATG